MATQTQRPRRKKRRIRYDRLLIVFVPLLIIIILITRCARKSDEPKPTPTDTPAASTEAATENKPTADYSHAVYLSPSNQVDSVYADGSSTEASVMRSIANQTAEILTANGITVVVADETDSLQDKVAAAANGKFAAYIALHSNSGEGSGTECYYNNTIPDSYTLADCVYRAVAAVTPNDDRGMIDGSIITDEHYLFEMGHNTVPCCLVEIEYHDSAASAQWIVQHEAEIAQAVADGISDYMASMNGGTGNDTAETQLSTDAGSGADAVEPQ